MNSRVPAASSFDENELIEKIERHDPRHFEVKLEYPLDPDSQQQRYTVEAWFFLPENLGVNRKTYCQREFYGDISDNIRFRTPRMSLAQILDGANALSPLTRTVACVARVRGGEASATARRTLAYESKMLANVLRVSLRELARLIDDTLRKGSPLDQQDAARLADDSIDRTAEILAAFRACGDALLDPVLDGEWLATHRLIDEFLSLTVESYALRLLEKEGAFQDDLCRKVAGLASSEVHWREGRGYRTVVRPGTANEEYVYRHALLKKFVANALYLAIERVDARRSWQTLAFGGAAGVAMAFATGVTFYAANLAPFSWTLFAVLVVSYVAKDRIKDAFREFFHRQADRWLADHDVRITDPSTGETIGRFRQKFGFVPPRELPDDVRDARAYGRTEFLAERESAEQVFRYEKSFRLRPRRVSGHHKRAAALTDVFRYNVRQLLHHMDEPTRTILHLDPGSSRPERVPAARTYHVNVVIRYGTGQKKRHYRKLRIVLDAMGILRVEDMSLPGL